MKNPFLITTVFVFSITIFLSPNLYAQGDECVDATPVFCGDFLADETTSGANPEIYDDIFCNTYIYLPDVWYSFQGTGQVVTFGAGSSNENFDISMYIFEGSCSNLNCIDYSSFDIATPGNLVEKSLFTEIGTTYYILVFGEDPANDNEGDFLFSVSCGPPVLQDFCNGAQLISCGGTASGTTFEATVDYDEINLCEGIFYNNPVGLYEYTGVWYRFEGIGDMVTFSTCSASTDFDAKLFIMQGSCNDLQCVETNPQACVTGTEVTTFTAVGLTYYIYVYGFNFFINSTGTQQPTDNFELSVSCGNSLCELATSISCGQTLLGTTDGLPPLASSSYCGTAITEPGGWYSFEGIGEETTFSTCDSGTELDTKISIYDGSCSDLNCITGNDQNPDCFDGNTSEISLFTEVGTTYYILVHGYFATGDFALSVSASTCEAVPLNSSCIYALPISCGETLTGTTVGASVSSLSDCGTSFTAPVVWYTFEGTGEAVTFSTCGSNTDFDTKLSVFTGFCSAFPPFISGLSCIAGNDDMENCSSNTYASEVTIETTLGSLYHIAVHGWSSQTGVFDLSAFAASCDEPPLDYFCYTAIPVSCGDNVSGTTIGANTLTDFCGGTSGFINSPAVVYSFEGIGVEVTFSTCSSNTDFDTILSVFEGECSDLDCVGNDVQNANCTNSSTSEITVSTALGTTYYIVVHGFIGGSGNFDLSVNGASCLPPPNDFCGDAIPISCGETLSGFTTGGTDDLDETLFCDVPLYSAGVWYSFVGTGEDANFNTCASANFDTQISVFDGVCGDLNCLAGSDSSFCENASEVTIPTEEGTTYYVLVHGFIAEGVFELSLTCTITIGVNTILSVAPVVNLQGALQSSTDGLMRDDLRTANLIPLTEPYTELSDFSHVGEGGGETIEASVLSVEGSDAIVDWVFVELRDPINPSQVLATRSALLQRDGDVVDVDGISPVEVVGLAGDYYVAIRHRNHLGAMTPSPLSLSNISTSIDFTTGNTWGEYAQVDLGGTYALWGGNANIDDVVIFQGFNNELNPIFFEVLGAPANTMQLANYTYEGYNIGDLDMNSLSIYQGLNNEINMLFFNALSHPDNTSNLANYIIEEQLP